MRPRIADNDITENAERFGKLMQNVSSMMPKIESLKDFGVVVDLSTLQDAVDAFRSKKRRRTQP